MKKIFSVFLSLVMAFTMCFGFTGISFAEESEVVDICGGVQGIYEPDTATLTVKSRSGSTVSMLKFYENNRIKHCDEIETIIVEDTINLITQYAFYNCSNLKTIMVYNSSCEMEENCIPDNKDIVIYGQTGSKAISFQRKYGYQRNRLYTVKFEDFNGNVISSALYPDGTDVNSVPKPDFSTSYASKEYTDINGEKVYQHITSAKEWRTPVTLRDSESIVVSVTYREKATDRENCTFDEGEKIPATCQYGEYTVYNCIYCGAEKIGPVESYLLPHDFDSSTEYVSNGDGTHNKVCAYDDCDEISEESYECEYQNKTITVNGEECVCRICKDCGYTYIDGFTVDSENCEHKNTAFLDETAKAPTCRNKGKEADTICLDCGAIIEIGDEIPSNHQSKATVEYDGEFIEPTCTEPGYRPKGTCTVCEKVIDKEKVIPADGHHEVPADNGFDATCTENGRNPDTICDKCGITMSVGLPIIAPGHDLSIEVPGTAVAPTCTTAGQQSDMKCSVCGYVEDGVGLPATGHNLSIELSGTAKPATCTENGKQASRQCSVCGIVVDGDVIPATGHTFIKGNATCLNCTAANPSYVPTTAYAPPQPVVTTQPDTAPQTTKKPTAPSGAKKVDGVFVNSKYKKPSISKLTKGKKQFKVSWKKVSGVSGYQIQYSTSSKFTKKTTKSSTIGSNKSKSPSKAIKSLKAKKTYYVRVRTYKNVKFNGKTVKVYSGWSKVKSVKTK